MPILKRRVIKPGQQVDWAKLDEAEIDDLVTDLEAIASGPPPRKKLEEMLFVLVELAGENRLKKTKAGRPNPKPLVDEEVERGYERALNGLLDWADELNSLAKRLTFKRRLAGRGNL